MPTGLSLDASTGVISGTPTAANTFNFTVSATNSAGNDTQALSITIDTSSNNNNNNNNNQGGNGGDSGNGGSFDRDSDSSYHNPATAHATATFLGGNVFTRGSGINLELSINRDFSLFRNLWLRDGSRFNQIAAENFGARSGSTIITVYADYLETLPTGSHMLEARFTSGNNVRAEFRIVDADPVQPPITDDDNDNPPTGRLYEHPFTDVHTNDWFNDYVAFVYVRGLMTGIGNNIFNPQGTVSRAMVVQVLYNLEGRPDISGAANPFTDVSADAWYFDAVTWAAANGIVAGFGDGTFRPSSNITRQDLSVMLNNYANFAGINLPQARPYQQFDDNADIADYAKEAIEQFFRAMVINGRPGNIFDPQGSATRAELAAMLKSFIEAAGSEN